MIIKRIINNNNNNRDYINFIKAVNGAYKKMKAFLLGYTIDQLMISEYRMVEEQAAGKRDQVIG